MRQHAAIFTRVLPLLAMLPVAALCIGCEDRALTWAQVEAMIARDFPDTPTMSIDDLRQRLNDSSPDIRLIDVRRPAEYTVSRLPGAVHEPDIERIAAAAEADPGQTLVVYCSVGYRSAEVAEQLHKRGHRNVFNLRGSIFAWANRGLPLIGPDGPTQQAHPYDAHWGQLLDPEHHP